LYQTLFERAQFGRETHEELERALLEMPKGYIAYDPMVHLSPMKNYVNNLNRLFKALLEEKRRDFVTR
jgi:hypothetical protein